MLSFSSICALKANVLFCLMHNYILVNSDGVRPYCNFFFIFGRQDRILNICCLLPHVIISRDMLKRYGGRKMGKEKKLIGKGAFTPC